MDYRKGEDFVSEERRKTCAKLLQTEAHAIEPTASFAISQESNQPAGGSVSSEITVSAFRDYANLQHSSRKVCGIYKQIFQHWATSPTEHDRLFLDSIPP